MTVTELTTRPSRNRFLAGAAIGAAVASLGFAAIGGAGAQAPRLVTPPPAVSLGSNQFSFADLVERVSPAVVSVLVEREVERPRIPDELQQFFQFRFGAPPEEFEGEPDLAEAQGSGFFIDASGHIVTNNHVIEGAKEIRVSLADGKELKATLVGADPLTDLAVLKVEPPRGQAFVQFAEDVNLRVGDWVVAVGNPFGLGGSVTSGIVSAIGGESRQGTFLDFIQIDAPINRGNSGGPTFDLNGRVVGVNTAIYSPNGGSVGIGFAIPAKSAKETVAQLIKNGSVTRGWLGVSIQPVDDGIKAALGLKETKGALVAEVLPGTPAAKAGVETQDLIVKLNGRDIADPRDLTRSISALAPGEKARLTVLRANKEQTLVVTLGARDAEQQVAAAPSANEGEDVLSGEAGVKVAEINEAARRQFQIPDGVNGVVVTGVKPGSAGADAGLQPGVVILQVDGAAVASTASLKKMLADAKKNGKDAVLLRLQVGEAKQFRALTIGKKEGEDGGFVFLVAAPGTRHHPPRRGLMRILVIEDDSEAAAHVSRGLREAGHVVDHALDGEVGLNMAGAGDYDAYVIDRMLPKLDGVSLLTRRRSGGDETPALFLSALGEVDDRVIGFKAGGDDYLVKPYAFPELLARVEALGRRRAAAPNVTTRYAVGDLEIDVITRTVRRDGRKIDLQPREFRLLEYLMRHAGQVVTRTMLLENVWEYHFDPQTNVIDVHISRLRSKIDKDFDKALLKTIRGAGYTITDQD